MISASDVLEDRLDTVPGMSIDFDGDCAQANGVDLPVVVINLPHRVDRWQTVSRRLAAIGLTRLIRAPAIDGRQLSDRQVATVLRSPAHVSQAPRSHLTLTRPAIGCFLSHLAVWRWARNLNLPRVLVLEDDAAPLAGQGPAQFRDVVTSIPAGIDLAFLGQLIMGGLADRHAGSVLARLYYFNGTFAYLITPKGCARLIAHALPMHAHLDHQLSQFFIAQRHVFPAYYAAPQLFEPDWSLRSDCYVPLVDDAAADCELGALIAETRTALLREGRLLLPVAT